MTPAAAAKCAYIERKYQSALRQIKASRQFTVEPWESWRTSFVIPEDAGTFPTVKEIKRSDGSGESWKAQGGAALKGRPKIDSPLCQTCFERPRYRSRGHCRPCFNLRRNAERAAQRKNKKDARTDSRA